MLEQASVFKYSRAWLVVLLTSAWPLCAAEDPVDFDRQVAPLLTKYCAGCHNDAQGEGDFSVSTLDSLRRGTPDGPVLVAKEPDASKLMQLVLATGDAKMPPEDEPQPTADEIALLRLWIEQGAAGESKPMTAAERPSVPKLPAAPPSAQYVGAACLVGEQSLAVGRLHSVDLIDASSNTRLWTNSDLPGKVNAIRLSHDGKVLIVSGGVAGLAGEVTLLDAASGKLIKRLQDHSDAVYCASLSPDGKWIASGGYDNQVIIWDAQSAQVVHRLSGHNGAIYDLDFDPTSRALVSASADQTVKLWNVDSGQRLDTFGQPEGEMLCVRFSRDGKFVFAGGADRQLRKWRIVSTDKPAINPLLAARFAHESEILQLQLVGDDRIATAARDRRIKLWDIAQLRPLAELGQAEDQPVALCVSGESAVTIVSLTGKPQLFALSSAAVPDKQNVAADDVPREPPSDESAEARDTPHTQQALHDALRIELPAEVSGVIGTASTQGHAQGDLYAFEAEAGQEWIFEVKAASKGSKLDSSIDILDDQGRGVVRTRLQAIRESYFTFRGKDSDTIDDFRLHKWEDMELDEYLYAGGEVVKLWLYPRGPDSGFKVYPGAGKRLGYFDTTAVSHALGAPVYIVRELLPGQQALPNGLPVFPIFFENDDDAQRRTGTDSRLSFIAPSDGRYYVRVRDARGFGGTDYGYTLSIRQPQPDFVPQANVKQMDIRIGSGQEWGVSVTRLDGLEERISVSLSGLPDGLVATDPLIIEEGQISGLGTIYATEAASQLIPPPPEVVDATDTDPAQPDAKQVQKEDPKKEEPKSPVYELTMLASCVVDGRTITHELPGKLQITVGPPQGIRFQIVDAQDATRELDELIIHPGQTVSARIVMQRGDDQAAISFGKEDSGRGLPHGAFVDNIGLNGLLIPSEQTQREFFITAAPKLQPGRYSFHLRTESAGNPTSRPLWLIVPEP